MRLLRAFTTLSPKIRCVIRSSHMIGFWSDSSDQGHGSSEPHPRRSSFHSAAPLARPSFVRPFSSSDGVNVSTSCLRAKQHKDTPYPPSTMPSFNFKHSHFDTSRHHRYLRNIHHSSIALARLNISFTETIRLVSTGYHISLTHQTAFGRNLTAYSPSGSLTHKCQPVPYPH